MFHHVQPRTEYRTALPWSGWLEDVKHANHMAVAPPGWEAPCFKPKDFSGAAAAASKSPKASKGPVTVLPAAAGARRESKMLEALDVAWMGHGPMGVGDGSWISW